MNTWSNVLISNAQTLATAESCTGGMIGAEITEIAGVSSVYLGGVVAYHNDTKHQLLGVSSQMLADHGAVSEPVAQAMALGAQQSFNSDWAIASTGIAGPGGGTEQKPVGLVWLAVAGPFGCTTRAYQFVGDRHAVRQQACTKALELLADEIKSAQNK